MPKDSKRDVRLAHPDTDNTPSSALGIGVIAILIFVSLVVFTVVKGDRTFEDKRDDCVEKRHGQYVVVAKGGNYVCLPLPPVVN